MGSHLRQLGLNSLVQVEETEDGDEASKLHKRLKEAKQHVWKRWRNEYIHSLLESHPVKRKTAPVPDFGEIVQVVGHDVKRRQGSGRMEYWCATFEGEIIMGVS